jgi:uncharacterized protein YdhG (YjbR/CyaY superfamily)
MSATAKKSNAKEKFTKEERAAMKARAREAKAGQANDESAVLEAIGEMEPHDRALAERFHAIVKETAPELTPRTYYGMPAYAKNGKVLCYFRNAAKFKERYAMVGFNDTANLDDGSMWPVAYALKELTDAEEARIRELVRQAAN